MGITRPAFPRIARAATAREGDEQPDLEAVQDYLQRFGYLADAPRAGVLDAPTGRSLAMFQRQLGVPESGEFDPGTREAMTRHRCAMPDLDSGVAFSTRCSWPNPNLTYAFETGTADTAGRSEFRAMRRAFRTWENASALSFAEVRGDQNPDIVVDWRPATDPDLSMVGGTLAHADFPLACGVVTDTLPKPVHFDDSEHLWVHGEVTGGFDVETVGLHEIGHIIGLQHSSVEGSVMFPTVQDDATLRSLTTDDLGGVSSLYAPTILAGGVYTIRQESSGRFLDAHGDAGKDFDVVTRTAQDNDTQRWLVTPLGVVLTLRHQVNGRFLDAHESSTEDFRAVTRTAQDNSTQRWAYVPDPVRPGEGTLQHLVNGRYLDAHARSEQDFRVVTRDIQRNDTQRWRMVEGARNVHTLEQVSSGRFLDAYESADAGFNAVTREAQRNDSQRWVVGVVGMVCTVQQVSSGRFVDAHESGAQGFSAVTRGGQFNDSQRWALVQSGTGGFTVQQLLRARFLDAHESAAQDFSVVTRPKQGNATQRWLFDRV